MKTEQKIYLRHAELCKVLSHPKRLEAINALRKGEMSVSALAKRLNISIGNLSQHLAMMKQRKILFTRKVGNIVYYRLTHPKMLKAFDILREILLEQLRGNSLLFEEITKKGG